MKRTMKFSVNGPATTLLLRPTPPDPTTMSPTTRGVDDRDNILLTNSIMYV